MISPGIDGGINELTESWPKKTCDHVVSYISEQKKYNDGSGYGSNPKIGFKIKKKCDVSGSIISSKRISYILGQVGRVNYLQPQSSH